MIGQAVALAERAKSQLIFSTTIFPQFATLIFDIGKDFGIFVEVVSSAYLEGVWSPDV
jgi:hypothetical protein